MRKPHNYNVRSATFARCAIGHDRPESPVTIAGIRTKAESCDFRVLNIGCCHGQVLLVLSKNLTDSGCKTHVEKDLAISSYFPVAAPSTKPTLSKKLLDTAFCKDVLSEAVSHTARIDRAAGRHVFCRNVLRGPDA